MPGSLRFFLIICLLGPFLLSGCKLTLVAVEGGDIGSASGNYFCPEGSNCVIEITATDFNETFIAMPKDGFVFSHWLAGDRLFCGNATEATCRLDNTSLAGDESSELVIASDFMSFLLPIFTPLPPPPSNELSPELQARYDSSCDQCHTSGRFGAPVIHDENAWRSRLNRGLDALLSSVKNGLGAMPSGGGCNNCSDDDYRALITYMSGPAG